MTCLPLANILHHKLRSAFSALGIGLGICMLVVLSGLSRGSLSEIADRWESVDADLIVYPRGLSDDVVTSSGAILSDRYGEKIISDHGDIVDRVVPVFVYPLRLAGQPQRALGVNPKDFSLLTGGKKLLKGRLFDPEGKFAAWIEQQLGAEKEHEAELFDPTEADLAQPERSGLELVIDARLAAAGGYKLGQTVLAAGHHWKIVGIVPTGVISRVFLPRRTAQFLFGDGDITKSTIMFVKLKPGVDAGAAAIKLRTGARHDVITFDRYRDMLLARFGILFTYVDVVNAIALVIAFLFIMITLYTMVLQQTREIAILKSCGASSAFILRQVLAESVLLTAIGTAVGIGLSFPAGLLIETVKPLLTVTITWQWILIAIAAAAIGSVVSGLYPAWRATRVDMVEALTLE